MCVCLYEFAPLNLMPGAHAAHLTGHVYIGIYAYPLPAPLTPFCPICPMCNDKSVPMAVRAQFPSFSNSSGLRQDEENKKNEKKKHHSSVKQGKTIKHQPTDIRNGTGILRSREKKNASPGKQRNQLDRAFRERHSVCAVYFTLK